MFRHLIVVAALLPVITACSQQQDAPASPAAREPATTAQATSEVEPAGISYAQVLQLQGVTFNVISPKATASNTVTVSTAGEAGWTLQLDRTTDL